MILYNKTLLDNLYLLQEAHQLKKSGFIKQDQYLTIAQQLPTIKHQKNPFVWTGFFILGAMLYSSICGLLSFIGLNLIEKHYILFLYFFALIGFVVKEYISFYFEYGLDDAFIFGGIAMLLTAVGLTFEENQNMNYLAVFITMSIVSAIAYLRYLNLSLALLACFGITTSLAYITFEYLIIGKSILSFVLLLFSGVCFFISNKVLQNITSPYYYNGLKLAKGFCLILFYLAGNYYVVRELNFSLSEDYFYSGTSPEIPFAMLFWFFTFSIPIVYLFFSIKNKDRMMLWIGFLALCFSFFTFRIYYHILPPEVVLTLGGLIVFAFAYFSIKKLKHNKAGLTFKVDRFTNPNAFDNLQTLVTASQFGLKPEAKVEESPMKFGGGEFSGGGSSGEF